jgi:translocation and assembly module TamB
MTIETAALDWRPAALFDRTLHVTEIAVTGLNIARAPTTPDQPDNAPSEDFAIPSLPVAVVLERLSVADLVLGAPVLGVPVSYRITGHAASQGAERLNAALTVERSDGVAGRLAVEATFDLSQEHLRASLEMTDPAGGLVAQLAEQPDLPALALSFSGDGTLAEWRGHLSATAEGLADAELDVTLDRAAEIDFGLTGQITAEALTDAPPWTLLAGRSEIDLAGSWSDQQALDLRTLWVAAPFGVLEASGQVDLANEQVDLAAELTLSDPERLAPLMAPAGFESARLSLTAAGPLMQPELSADVVIERPSAPQITTEEVAVHATFRPESPIDQGAVAGVFSAEGHVAKLMLEGQESLAPLIGDKIVWGAEGTVDLASEQLVLSSLTLDAADLGLQGSGRLDLASLAAEADVTLGLETLAGLAPLIGLELQGAGQMKVNAQVSPEAQSIEAEVNAGLSNFAVSDPALAELAAVLLGKEPRAKMKATFEPSGGRLSLSALTFEGNALDASATAEIALEPLTGEAEATVALSDLSGLGPNLGVPLGGAAEISGRVELAEEIAATLEARLRHFAVDDPAITPWLEALAGAGPSLRASARLSQDGAVNLDQLNVEGTALQVTAKGQLSPGYDTLSLRYEVGLAELQVLSEPLGLPVAGQLRLTGTVDGAVADPSVTANLLVEQGQVDAAHFSRLETKVAADKVVSAPRGQVTIALATPQGDFEGEAKLALETDILKIPALALRGEGATIDGVLSAPLGGGPLSGELTADLKTLAPWLGLAGLAGDGALTAQASLRPDGSAQGATVEARLSDFDFQLSPEEKLEISAVELSAKAGDLTGTPEGTVTIEGSELALGELRLDTFSAQGNGGAAAAQFELMANGHLIEDLVLAAAGRVETKGQAVQVSLTTLDGSLIGEALHLKTPLSFTQDGGTFALNGLDLSFGPAALTGNARLDDAGVAADVELQGLPLELARLADPSLNLGGTFSAELRLQGPLTDPRGTAGLTVTDLEMRDMADVPPVSSQIDAEWRNGRIALTGTVSGIPGAGVDLKAELPLRLVPETYAIDLPQDQPISGELAWQGRLGRVWPLVPLDGHEADGEVDLQFALSGTLADPRVLGHLDLAKGSYENLDSGTLLKDLSVKVAMDEAQAVNLTVNTTDGAKGKLNVEGAIKIAPEEAFPFDITTDFNEFTLVRRDDVTASASGKIRVHGTAERADLVGQVETRRIEIRLIDALPPAVADLGVIEEDGPQSEAGKTSPGPEAVPFDLGLDLAVAMPAKVYVRGRGLDSEWAGDLKVAGSAAEPRIEGELNLVRGTLALVGKNFRLDSGKVQFAGGESIDPLIDVAAVHKGAGFTATIRLAGPATQPELIMTSVPELPQDEILARVLFDKSASELSTTEALQLAAAVAELTGGTGDSALDTARELLGVDVLRLESSEDGSTTPSVAAGKYVADNVYVGVKQGATTTSSAVEVEIELTPNISVGSEVGQDGNNNVGIQFKWDY